ncbi:hypothetical protein [Nitrosarchaeum koreense]|uniref:Uncharacterized protein n=1 Tax=Nitrosarchaeum koreense MY1 TaxID=1001994 RepID=F9CWG9_9ARCH|nr:hypothetical protein [Nitrosarchaeum koreense]EGP93621.1 hypothetical protein MY1_0859 [Nitrosarchaeum koreense MY1]
MEENGIWGKYDVFLKIEHDAELGLDRFVEILRRWKTSQAHTPCQSCLDRVEV